MKKLILCNYLFIKRCLKRTSFIILLLLIPILCMVFKTNIEDTKISIKTGLYIESEDNLTNKICNNLKIIMKVLLLKSAAVLMNLHQESLPVIMNVDMYLTQISVKKSMKIRLITL